MIHVLVLKRGGGGLRKPDHICIYARALQLKVVLGLRLGYCRVIRVDEVCRVSGFRVWDSVFTNLCIGFG